MGTVFGSGYELVTSTTRPSSPITGQMIYESDTASFRWYGGSSWVGMIPVGTTQPFAGSTAPIGWLLCAGQSLNAVTSPIYADLFTVIGTTYGGTGNTAFNLPDMRGRTVVARDNMAGTAANRLDWGTNLGTTGGAQYHTLDTSQLPSHVHTGPSHTHNFSTGNVSNGHTHYYEDTYWSENVWGNWGWAGSPVGLDYDNSPGARWGKNTGDINNNHTHSGTTVSDGTGNTGSSGSGSSHNNMPPAILLNYIIKY